MWVSLEHANTESNIVSSCLLTVWLEISSKDFNEIPEMFLITLSLLLLFQIITVVFQVLASGGIGPSAGEDGSGRCCHSKVWVTIKPVCFCPNDIRRIEELQQGFAWIVLAHRFYCRASSACQTSMKLQKHCQDRYRRDPVFNLIFLLYIMTLNEITHKMMQCCRPDVYTIWRIFQCSERTSTVLTPFNFSGKHWIHVMSRADYRMRICRRKYLVLIAEIRRQRQAQREKEEREEEERRRKLLEEEEEEEEERRRLEVEQENLRKKYSSWPLVFNPTCRLEMNITRFCVFRPGVSTGPSAEEKEASAETTLGAEQPHQSPTHGTCATTSKQTVWGDHIFFGEMCRRQSSVM